MPTPSIQTLVTDAQQVLNLDSISAVRSVVAVALANANTGTPLNPNLTTQQLWNEFYQVVNKPKSDIESIIANQLMKLLYAPPAPGGVGADQQVIFNDGGVLAGDPQFLWNKTTNLLTVTGATTITGDLTVDTTSLKVTGGNASIGTATPNINSNRTTLTLNNAAWGGQLDINVGAVNHASFGTDNFSSGLSCRIQSADGIIMKTAGGFVLQEISAAGVFTFKDGAGGTRMTLNSTGLGVGVTPSAINAGRGLEVGAVGNGLWCSNSTFNQILQNAYYNSGFKYAASASTAASRLEMGGAFNFYIAAAGTAGNAITWNQAMTLTATGSLLVNATTLASNEMLRVNSLNLNGWTVCMTSVNRGWLNRQSDANGGIAAYFEVGSSNTNVGSITTTSSATSYTTTSDYRLKESVHPLIGGLARVNALKPSIYKWKSNGSDGEGFLAHELADVVPSAVVGEKDAINEDGSIKAQGVDLSKVVPILVAAIKELTARVEALEA